MKTIEEEFPPENEIDFEQDLTLHYTRLRARAVDMERKAKFLEWQLAAAQERWDDARKLEREGALDGQEAAAIMSNTAH
jgi:hypothetical protein